MDMNQRYARALCLSRLVRLSVSPCLLQDRKHNFVSYRKCFVGSELVDWLVAREHAKDRAEATSIGQDMLSMLIAHHVTFEHRFEDASLFYRFYDDDPIHFLVKQAHRAFRRPYWDMRSSAHCAICDTSFRLSVRRHHCRHCGRLVCNSCSKSRLRLPHMDYLTPVRVCRFCHLQLSGEAQQSGASGAASDRFQDDEESLSVASFGGESISEAVFSADSASDCSGDENLRPESNGGDWTKGKKNSKRSHASHFVIPSAGGTSSQHPSCTLSASEFARLLPHSFPDLRSADGEWSLMAILLTTQQLLSSSHQSSNDDLARLLVWPAFDSVNTRDSQSTHNTAVIQTTRPQHPTRPPETTQPLETAQQAEATQPVESVLIAEPALPPQPSQPSFDEHVVVDTDAQPPSPRVETTDFVDILSPTTAETFVVLPSHDLEHADVAPQRESENLQILTEDPMHTKTYEASQGVPTSGNDRENLNPTTGALCSQDPTIDDSMFLVPLPPTSTTNANKDPPHVATPLESELGNPSNISQWLLWRSSKTSFRASRLHHSAVLSERCVSKDGVDDCASICSGPFGSNAGDDEIAFFEANYEQQKEAVRTFLGMVKRYNSSTSSSEQTQVRVPNSKEIDNTQAEGSRVVLSLDISVLLKYLRARKYNCNKAFRRMLRFEQFVQQWYWMQGLSAAHLEAELSCGVVELLQGSDREGRGVIVIRFAKLDLSSVHLSSTLQSYQMAACYLLQCALENTITQLRGVTVIMDFKGISSSLMQQLTRESIARTVEMLQGKIPMRVCRILLLHHYSALVSLLRPFLSTKMNHRLVSIRRVEELQKFVDPRFLPADFGGSNTLTAKDWTAQRIAKEAGSK